MPQLGNAALFFCVNVFIVSILSQITYGQDSCEAGTCIEALDCPSAKESILMHGQHNLKRCGWNKFMEKVCCLDEGISSQSGEPSTTSEEVSSTTSDPVTTTKKNEPRGTVRKSEEACARYSANVPFSINYHILGGEAAEAGEFPHMTALGYQKLDGGSELEWICGGSLISERYVLTAAHCVVRRKPVRALMGVLNITEQSDTRKEFNIENITVHPSYTRRNSRNDIALLRMAEMVQFGGNIYPACLYQKSDDPLGLIITGWGKLLLGQDIFSDGLQKARVVPISLTSCNETYISRINRPLSTSQICAGAPDPMNPTDSCPGDSGGPMQVVAQDNMYAIVGIVSFGLTDCGGDAPSVYTRVYQYLDWIEPLVWL